MCPLPPATEMTRYLRCCPTAGSLWCCASRIPWASTPRGWTAGSMIRRLVGREKACGLPTALELLFTRKVVKEPRARSCISSFAPTRSRTRHLRAELEAKGVPVREGSWGYRLLVVDDPDGNQLFFNYPAETASGKIARDEA